MKKIAILLLALSLALCGCSEFSVNDDKIEENTSLNSDIVSEDEQEIHGEEIQLDKNDLSKEENEDIAKNTEISSPTVYRTHSGEKYHIEGCYYLKSKIETTIDAAKSMGLKPCSRCQPPQ